MSGINFDAELDRLYPDPQDEEPIMYCSECQGEIYEGDDYWNIDEPFCDECAQKLFRYVAGRK